MTKEKKTTRNPIAAFHIVYINLSILLLFLFDAELKCFHFASVSDVLCAAAVVYSMRCRLLGLPASANHA